MIAWLLAVGWLGGRETVSLTTFPDIVCPMVGSGRGQPSPREGEMTDEQARALGLRAVACEGWRWLPGMLVGPAEIRGRIGQEGDPDGWVDRFDWPDFRDPCTLGGLLALVRETWQSAGREVWVGLLGDDGVEVEVDCAAVYFPDLVAALEAAP